MPFAGVIIGFLVNAMRVMFMAKAAFFVVKILAFFGLNFVANKYAIQPMLDALRDYALAGPSGGGLGATVMQWAGVLRFDQALSMILSAFGMAASIRSARVMLGLSGT